MTSKGGSHDGCNVGGRHNICKLVIGSSNGCFVLIIKRLGIYILRVIINMISLFDLMILL